MASATSNVDGDAPRLPKFDGGANFPKWKTSIRLVLMDKDLWEVVNGEEPAPTKKLTKSEQSIEDLTQEYRAWKRKDTKALVIIYNSLGDNVKPTLTDDQTSKDLWDILTTTYGQMTRADIAHLVSKFSLRRKEEGESMQTFLQEMHDLYTTIISSRQGILNEDYFIIKICMSVPEQYSSTTLPLLNQSKLTIEEMKAQLLNADAALRAQREVGSTSHTMAMSASSSSTISFKDTIKDGKVICGVCEKPGHKGNDCWKLAKNASKRPPSWGRPRNSNRQQANKATSSSARDEQVDTQTVETITQALKLSNAFIATVRPQSKSSKSALLAQAQQDDVEIVADCGASCHMFKEGACVFGSKPSDQVVGTAEKGKDLLPSRQGTALFSVNGEDFSLKETLHVPMLSHNLLSLGAAHANGAQFYTVGNDKLVLQANDKQLIATRGEDNLYRITAKAKDFPAGASAAVSALVTTSASAEETTTKEAASSEDKTSSPASSPDSAEILVKSSKSWKDWHEIFGHASSKILELTLKHYGITPPPAKFDGECDACQKGKATTTPTITRRPESKVTTPLGRLHADLWGPSKYPTAQGSRYFLTLVDEATHMTCGVPLATKDAAAPAIKMWVSFAEKQTGQQLKVLRTDKGGEFMGAGFKAWLNNASIKHEVTVVGVSASDGVVERMHRTILNIVRTWNIQHQFPQEVWGELVVAATLIINRRWTSAVNNVPVWLWDKSKPNVTAMLPVGPCYMHVNRPGQDKFAPRAVEGWIVGYDDSHTYRVFVNGTVVVSRDVRPRKLKQDLDNVPNVSYDDLGFRTAAPPPLLDDGDTSIAAEQISDTSVASSAETEITRESENIGQQEEKDGESGGSSTASTAREVREDGLSPAQAQPVSPPAEPATASSVTSSPPSQSSGSRQSSRTTRQPTRFGYGLIAQILDASHDHSEPLDLALLAEAVISFDGPEPKTYEEAMTGPERIYWQPACDRELMAHKINKTWHEDVLPEGREPISPRWLFRRKRDDKGKVAEHKARVVARGFSQKEGFEYEPAGLYAPVSSVATFRVFLALCIQRRLYIKHVDVETAFLHGEIDVDIYMTKPPGYPDSTPGTVLKLDKSLYGLKQAPKIWHQKLRSTLNKMGFHSSLADPCLYERNVLGKPYVGLLAYVDDLLLAAADEETLAEIVKELSSYFKIKDLGRLTWYLGISINYNPIKGVASINQESYIESVIKRFGQEDAPLAEVPVAAGKVIEPSPNVNKSIKDNNFAQLLGCLLYISMSTRPDITFAVQKLAKCSHAVSNSTWKSAKQVLRYLHATKSLNIVYRTDVEGDAGKFVGYCDAAEGGDNNKGVTGLLFKLAGGPVTWATKNQRKHSASAMEAELNALFTASNEAKWLEQFYELALTQRIDIKQPKGISKPLILHTDSQPAIAWVNNFGVKNSTKFYERELKYLRQTLDDNNIKLEYLNTKQQLADAFTKALPRDQFLQLRTTIGLV